jgi:hypothetical protein
MDEHARHPAAESPQRLLAACQMRRLRRSGPGGQHRNKVETAVVLHHLPTGVKAEASERRNQAENRAAALFRLRLNLALAVRCRPGEAGPPSRLWRSRCAGGRIAINLSHDDFPAILAEALDVIDDAQADVRRAAEHLRCSMSQLVKLLKKEPRSLLLVNQWRQEQGLRELK